MKNKIDKDNLLDIVSAGFRNRFQNLSPFQFEKLVQLLLDDYYKEAQLTKKGGDFGGDVICYDHEENKIVVQCKRYKKGNNVGNKYIDNVISSKIYYEADKGLIVTTSSFTKSAVEIANKADIELWDWSKLVEVLSITLNNGEPLAKLLQNNESQEFNSIDSFIEANITLIEQSGIVQNNRETSRVGNFIKFEIINKTSEILEVNMGIPLVLKNNQQYDIDSWWSGYFSGGTILPNATVTSGIIIDTDKVGVLNMSNTKLFVELVCQEKNSGKEFRDFIEVERKYKFNLPNPHKESSDSKSLAEMSDDEYQKFKHEILPHKEENNDKINSEASSKKLKVNYKHKEETDDLKSFLIALTILILFMIVFTLISL